MPSQTEPSNPDKVIRVLHVDDEQGQLDFTKSFVEQSDSTIKIESVSTPEAALRRLEEEFFNCVVSDYQMPVLNGIELALKIREINDIPIIIYTGRGSEEVAEDAFAAEIDDYIRKETNPSHYQVLARRIRSAVDRHRSEKNLVDSLAQYQALFDSVGDSISLIDPATHIILSANQATLQFYGLEESELIGRHCCEVFHGVDSFPASDCPVSRLLETGKSVMVVHQHVGIDGHVRYTEVAVHPIRDELGEIVQVIRVSRDITEQKMMEKETKQYQKRLEALHAHVSQLARARTKEEVFAITLNTMREALGFGYQSFHTLENGVLSTPITLGGPSLVPPMPIDGRGITTMAAREARTVLVNDVREEPAFVKGYLDSLSELAVPVIIDERVEAVINAESEELDAYDSEDKRLAEILADHVASAMGVIQSRRMLEEIHEEHSRELLDGIQRVSSMVRHDLRGPLQTIMNAAYVAEKNPERTGEMMEIIMASVRHQSEIMDDWKSQGPEEILNVTETDLSELIADPLAATLIPSHITVDVNTEPMKVSLDKVKMMRVLDNLIRNAVEAMEEEGTLTISAREDEGGIIIGVSDTGIGIPDSEMGSLFKPFYTTKSKGVGLGLAYCKQTVEAHGGTISVESEVGVGTTVTVRLPINPSDSLHTV